ncbi:hypothetical protein [Pasteurella multocida]|uniref:hypothetical protein n=1 Tax=Pasteurella multocida TaxID=747 RepID=UPI0015E1D419|nr:hypothetical protein [Pasteurella multocida]HDR1501864.1 hypothetical protein [Pasteurella multocida]
MPAQYITLLANYHYLCYSLKKRFTLPAMKRADFDTYLNKIKELQTANRSSKWKPKELL